MTRSPSIKIRQAVIDEVDSLQRLIIESVRGLSNPYYSQQQIESALSYIFGVDTQLILDGTYYVAEHGETIIACGGWSKRHSLYGGDQRKSATDPLLDPMTEPARIRAFFVHPQWARRGIGRRVLEFCEEAARESGFKRLELVATLPGRPLYSATGYVVIEPMKLPTPDGESLDAFRMGKALEQRRAFDQTGSP